MKNSPLNTSLRSAIHATDSTCSGWTANTAATENALRHMQRTRHLPHYQEKQDRRSRMDEDVGEDDARPRSRPVAICQSIMCEMEVSGV